MRKKSSIMIIALAGCFGILSAQQPAIMVSGKPGWHKIASTTVDFKKDRDEVKVLGADRFTSLKFTVTDAPVDIQSIEVLFHDGTKQNIRVDSKVEKGKESRMVDLPGAQKEIDKIMFVYKTLPNRNDERASIDIYGLKVMNPSSDMSDTDHERARAAENARLEREKMNTADNAGTGKNNATSTTVQPINAPAVKADGTTDPSVTPADPLVPAPAVVVKDKSGWVRIGFTKVDFKIDKDEVAVIGADRFAKLKFKAIYADIEITSITVLYQDGSKQSLPVKASLKEGQESSIMDVPGAEKDIAKIMFSYRSLANQGKDKAHVEIWGMKTNSDKTVGEKR